MRIQEMGSGAGKADQDAAGSPHEGDGDALHDPQG
jgi:hypothetical protein